MRREQTTIVTPNHADQEVLASIKVAIELAKSDLTVLGSKHREVKEFHEKEISSLSARHIDHKKQFTEFSENTEKIKQDLKNEISTLEDKKKESDQKLEIVLNKISEVSQNKDILFGDIDKLKKEVKSLTIEQNELIKNINSKKADLDSIESKIIDAQKEFKDIELKISEQKNIFEKSKFELDSKKVELVEVNNYISEATNIVKKIELEAVALRTKKTDELSNLISDVESKSVEFSKKQKMVEEIDQMLTEKNSALRIIDELLEFRKRKAEIEKVSKTIK